MELYAAKRVRKQQEKLKLQQQEEDIEKQRLVALSSSIEQRHKLDSLFGILEPPTIIYCLCLGSETAGIWWLTSSNSNGSSKVQNQEVLSWEIHRYRLDNKEQNIWSYKGYIEIKYLKNIKQFIYSNLQNGYEVIYYPLFASSLLIFLPSPSYSLV